MSQGDSSTVLALPADATCLGCGYSLRELTLPRCPECGMPFTPGDFKTYNCYARTVMMREPAFSALPIVIFAMVTFVATLVIGYLAVAGLWASGEARAMLAIIPGAAIGLAARSLCREWVDVDEAPADLKFQKRFRKRAWIFAAVTLLLVLVDVWSCPHGTGVKVGPCAITHTGPDGMCRTHVLFQHRHELTERWSFYFLL